MFLWIGDMLGKFRYLWIILGCCLFLSSCAQAPVKPGGYLIPQTYQYTPYPAVRQDIYHVVGPAETIWRLSKMYDVKMNDIVKANNLRDINKLEMGERLLIPNAMPIKSVIYLYPSDKWKYIIIHHSATDEGNSLNFHISHRSRGWETVGYHFVIDNGSQGKCDGQIEATPRWIKQQDGAHCKAANMNSRGIGICVVGDFNTDRPTRKQMESLAYLANLLSNYYDVPDAAILGHGSVNGARTDCPGKKFPWQEFQSRLRANAKKR